MGRPNEAIPRHDPQPNSMMSCGAVTLVPICTPGNIQKGLRGPWASKTSLCLGIFQIILGVLLIVAQSLLFAKHTVGGIHGMGFLCGILFIVTGCFGIAAGKSKTKCTVVTLMVLTIVSASFTSAIFIGGGIGIAVDDYELSNDYYNYNRGYGYDSCYCDYSYPDYHDYYDPMDPMGHMDEPHTGTTLPCRKVCTQSAYGYYRSNGLRRFVLSLHGLMMVFALLELIIAVVTSALTCRAVKCCTSQPQQQYAYVLPTGQAVNPGTSMIAAPAVLQVNANGVNGYCPPVDMPAAVPTYEETEASRGTRPPSYVSLNGEAKQTENAPMMDVVKTC